MMVPINEIEQDQLYDIYGMIHVPWWQTRLAYGLAIAFGVLCGALLLWYVVKKIRARMIKKTAWDRAFDALQALVKNRYILSDDQWYVQLTDILKAYFQQRYDLDLRGKTDEEVAICLENALVSSQIVEDLRAVLRETVMIKYAAVSAQSTQRERSLDASKAVITKTVPSEKL